MARRRRDVVFRVTESYIYDAAAVREGRRLWCRFVAHRLNGTAPGRRTTPGAPDTGRDAARVGGDQATGAH